MTRSPTVELGNERLVRLIYAFPVSPTCRGEFGYFGVLGESPGGPKGGTGGPVESGAEDQGRSGRIYKKAPCIHPTSNR